MNILFVSSEAAPFALSGGLADVAGALPKAINKAGGDCRVVMPLYSIKCEKYRENFEYHCNFSVPVAWRSQYCGIFSTVYEGVTYYFIDNEYYFKREGLYGYYDDAERFAFFSRAVMEMLDYIDFKPDILHCNDWQSALVPIYYDLFYRYKYPDIKTVFTIHNILYQGRYGMDLVEEIFGIPTGRANLVEFDGDSNLMKGAIEVADKVTTVSPTYAREILDPFFGHGLDRILNGKQYKTCGFLNGIDVESYNPETDKNLPANYSARSKKNKVICKSRLLAEVGLPDGDEPVLAVITRFVQNKGVDLIRYAMDSIIEMGYKVVVLGSGDREYENYFRYIQSKYPDRIAVRVGFIPSLARKIYAGADMFLMPSQTEPCGLAQMIALRYGTIPIVRETGGLADSIKDLGGENGNGYTFKTYNGDDMANAIWRAKEDYWNKQKWSKIVTNALKQDFSWDRSAELYMGLYRDVSGKE